MKIRLSAIAFVVAGLASSLLLSSCNSTGAMSESPYFGVDDRNKRFVPKELHEEREP
jgi:hypothetical protein